LRNCDQLGRQPIGDRDFNHWLEIALKKDFVLNPKSLFRLRPEDEACGSHNNVNELYVRVTVHL